ncbi:MAG: protein-L-isoaspartate(D-aspartate) O-methyltransferase [Bacteroidales bacterium]|jgi:protein-L-isoaspartate(D-aspartate) O-methyltransferase|nr:protein-L-isoaspartate(D-aspartate) O-methyltransferase [Bacteroidales bacterium]
MEYLQGAKKGLITLLKSKGIHDELVLTAFDQVERHLFIESFLWPHAYEDIALQIHCNQTISQPYTVAFQSQLLQVKKGDKILEIGTGSGFQAAILSNMGAKVYSIERQYDLYKKTKKLLEKIDYKIITIYGDGFEGNRNFAPYDKMIVTCGAPNVPISLLNQLKTGGMIVIPVGEGTQKMKRITKVNEDEFQEEVFGDFVFVPMLRNRSGSETHF